MAETSRLVIQAVLFDWAGTTLDYGSCAPVAAFVEVFRRNGVEITDAEARGPMGMGKLDHIAALAKLPRVEAEWTHAHGAPPGENDLRRMYEAFLPVQMATLADHAELIPGTVESVAFLRQRGIAIGTSTGYGRSLIDVILPLAKEQGYAPDVTVCVDDVPQGRPDPAMNLFAAERLGALPGSSVAVDDTVVGIEAARRAGMVAVAVALTGNAYGLDRTSSERLSNEERESRRRQAYDSFRTAQSDFTIDSVADLPAILPQIETLIAGRRV